MYGSGQPYIRGLSVPPLQKSSPFLASNPRNTEKHLGPQCPPSAKELTLFGIQPQMHVCSRHQAGLVESSLWVFEHLYASVTNHANQVVRMQHFCM